MLSQEPIELRKPVLSFLSQCDTCSKIFHHTLFSESDTAVTYSETTFVLKVIKYPKEICWHFGLPN